MTPFDSLMLPKRWMPAACAGGCRGCPCTQSDRPRRRCSRSFQNAIFIEPISTWKAKSRYRWRTAGGQWTGLCSGGPPRLHDRRVQRRLRRLERADDQDAMPHRRLEAVGAHEAHHGDRVDRDRDAMARTGRLVGRGLEGRRDAVPLETSERRAPEQHRGNAFFDRVVNEDIESSREVTAGRSRVEADSSRGSLARQAADGSSRAGGVGLRVDLCGLRTCPRRRARPATW